MPQMSTMKKTRTFRMLGLGDSGSGKTGSLVSVINSMDSLGIERVIISDWDDGLDVLLNFVKPEFADKVFIETLRDEMVPNLDSTKLKVGTIVRGSNLADTSGLQSKMAWTRGLRLMSNWKTPTTDLGRSVDWGPETLYVCDTLTGMGDACMNFANAILKEDDWRGTGSASRFQHTYTQLCMALKCHFILFSHVRHMGGGGKVTIRESPEKGGQTQTKETDSNVDGTAYPSALGRLLPTQIGRHFNTQIEYKIKGELGKRVICTRSSERFPLKVPFTLPRNELDQETGLLTLFKKLIEQ